MLKVRRMGEGSYLKTSDEAFTWGQERDGDAHLQRNLLGVQGSHLRVLSCKGGLL